MRNIGQDYQIPDGLWKKIEALLPPLKPKKKSGRPRKDDKKIPGYRARRWVVERTHSWMNRFRRLLIRWEKKVENYTAMLHLACAWITFRSTGLFG